MYQTLKMPQIYKFDRNITKNTTFVFFVFFLALDVFLSRNLPNPQNIWKPAKMDKSWKLSKKWAKVVLHGSPRFSNCDKIAPKPPISQFSNIWGQLHFLDKKSIQSQQIHKFCKKIQKMQQCQQFEVFSKFEQKYASAQFFNKNVDFCLNWRNL